MGDILKPNKSQKPMKIDKECYGTDMYKSSFIQQHKYGSLE